MLVSLLSSNYSIKNLDALRKSFSQKPLFDIDLLGCNIKDHYYSVSSIMLNLYCKSFKAATTRRLNRKVKYKRAFFKNRKGYLSEKLFFVRRLLLIYSQRYILSKFDNYFASLFLMLLVFQGNSYKFKSFKTRNLSLSPRNLQKLFHNFDFFRENSLAYGLPKIHKQSLVLYLR